GRQYDLAADAGLAHETACREPAVCFVRNIGKILGRMPAFPSFGGPVATTPARFIGDAHGPGSPVFLPSLTEPIGLAIVQIPDAGRDIHHRFEKTHDED